jgi:hypothetical protein
MAGIKRFREMEAGVAAWRTTRYQQLLSVKKKYRLSNTEKSCQLL